MYRGYIKLWRRLTDSDFWKSEKFSRPQAWIDLLMLANHKDSFFRARGQRVDVRRGQVAYSEVTLSQRWKWSRGKVRRFLQELESETEQKIEQHKNNITTLITIINYELYQCDGTTLDTPNGTPNRTPDGTHLKNVKNVKEEKNVSAKRRRQLPPDFSLSENLKEFAKKHGINGSRIDEVFSHFCEYHRSRGNTMADWNLAFMTWVRNDVKFSNKKIIETQQQSYTPPDRITKLMQQAAERERYLKEGK